MNRIFDDLDKILEEARNVVNMFDQANTSNIIRDLSLEGYKVCIDINNLRRALIKVGIYPVLSENQ